MHSFWFFILASIGASLAPGPDNLYVLTLGMGNRRRQALAAAWGMISGILVHTTLAAFGISSLFAASPLLFTILKIAGSGYLFYLAYHCWKDRNRSLDLVTQESDSGIGKMFLRGFLMNVLNPKVLLFFLAFLPQFVDYSLGKVSHQMFILGITFMAQALVIFTLIALLASIFGKRLRQNQVLQKWISIATSILFTIVALNLLVL